MADLVEKIDVKNTTLFESLVQFGVCKLSDMEYIKVSTGSILLYGRD